MGHKGKAQASTRFENFTKEMPVLQSVGPKDILFSRNWIARGAIQRVGAIIISILFLLCSVALFVGSLMVKAQTSEIMGGASGQLFGITLTLLGFFLTFVMAFLAIRLLLGVGRSLCK